MKVRKIKHLRTTSGHPWATIVEVESGGERLFGFACGHPKLSYNKGFMTEIAVGRALCSTDLRVDRHGNVVRRLDKALVRLPIGKQFTIAEEMEFMKQKSQQKKLESING